MDCRDGHIARDDWVLSCALSLLQWRSIKWRSFKWRSIQWWSFCKWKDLLCDQIRFRGRGRRRSRVDEGLLELPVRPPRQLLNDALGLWSKEGSPKYWILPQTRRIGPHFDGIQAQSLHWKWVLTLKLSTQQYFCVDVGGCLIGSV